jgi:hypothetical protein
VLQERGSGCSAGGPEFCGKTVKTTGGPITVARPKLRGAAEAFASQLFGKTVTKTNALESLVIAGFVRGLSVREVENSLADVFGAEAALSKTTVSRVCQAIAEECAAWSARRLDEVVLDYLFLNAFIHVKMHPGARAEPVLTAWASPPPGAPVFVALAAGGSESTDPWGGFLNQPTGAGCAHRCWSSPTAARDQAVEEGPDIKGRSPSPCSGSYAGTPAPRPAPHHGGHGRSAVVPFSVTNEIGAHTEIGKVDQNRLNDQGHRERPEHLGGEQAGEDNAKRRRRQPHRDAVDEPPRQAPANASTQMLCGRGYHA